VPEATYTQKIHEYTKYRKVKDIKHEEINTNVKCSIQCNTEKKHTKKLINYKTN